MRSLLGLLRSNPLFGQAMPISEIGQFETIVIASCTQQNGCVT
jgi:hypothetical protein